MEQLRDIRGLEEIPDISLYFFILMVLFILLIIGGLGVMLYRHFSTKKGDITKKEVRKRLEEVDLENSKKAAYLITKYARYLAEDERSRKIFMQLEEKLKKYKYVKNPPPLEDEAIHYYELFLEVIDG